VRDRPAEWMEEAGKRWVAELRCIECSAVQCSAVQCSAVLCERADRPFRGHSHSRLGSGGYGHGVFHLVQCSAVQCSAVQC
jgi:hypothetical protein